MKTQKHHLIPCEAGGRGINGHSAFFCYVNEIIVMSNNDILGDKWYVDNGHGEGSGTVWYSSPTTAAIAYYDQNN